MIGWFVDWWTDWFAHRWGAAGETAGAWLLVAVGLGVAWALYRAVTRWC